MSHNIFDKGSPASLFAALTAGAAIKYAACCLMPQKAFVYVGRVGQIWLYPFKSFKGITVQEADCTKLGMKWKDFTDRHWTVATSNGVYLTQRQEPTMALIEPSLAGDHIKLSAPGMEPISFPADPPVTEYNKSKVTVKTDTIDSLDLGDDVAQWLCTYFKREGLRLHYSAPSLEKRDSSNNKKAWKHPAKQGDMCALHDYCGFMILSNASLVDLNKRLDTPVPITNFRANIIVDDCQAYAEDNWSSVKIGDSNLRALDACTRCLMVTVDQEKGVKDPQEEPLKTLKTYRLKDPYGPKPTFGINFTTDNPGKIRVGDPIYAKLR